MFKTINIKNFRGLQNFDIDNLSNINIFVGDNATGKTAVLDAIYLLINPNNPLLSIKTNNWRNLLPFTPSFWRSFFYNFDINNKITLAAISGKEKRVLNIIARKSQDEKILSGEKSTDELKTGSEIDKAIIGLNLIFQVGKTKHRCTIEQTSVNEVRHKIDEGYKESLFGNYLNNITYANELDSSAKFDTVNQEVGKEDIIAFLQYFKPQIIDIELDRFQKLIVKDKSFDKRVYMNTYGDGMVRGLHILLDVLPKQSKITLIDEIENGLHPSKQELLWSVIHKLIKERNQQLFVTTHSLEMLKHLRVVAKKEKFFDSIRLFRLNKVDDKIGVVLYSPKELDYAITHDLDVR